MATDLNSVVLVGRITKDVGSDDYSWGFTPNGTAKAIISLAVHRSHKDSNSGEWVDEASFINVTLWGKQAESLKPYLVKGQQIAVDGYIKQDRWEKDGKKFSALTVIANSIQLLGGRKSSDNDSNGGGQGFTQKQGAERTTENPRGISAQNSSVPTGEGFPEDILF